MQGIRVNRNLLKLVYQESRITGREYYIDLYRFYVIARSTYAYRSGIFSFAEFCDELHANYGYKSLHCGPGNARGAFKRKWLKRFQDTFLFTQCPDSRFRVNSERKILYRYKGTTKSSWYEVPDPQIMQSKRLFTDFCIGMQLSGNKFRANSNIAKLCNVTSRRIQYATSRNHSSYNFRKQYNFIEERSAQYKKIEQERAWLFNEHGISTPKPTRYKSEYILRLNAPNSYKSFVLSGVKGFSVRKGRSAQPTSVAVKKKVCWFKPVREAKKNKQLSLFRELVLFKNNYKRWHFNEEVYNLGSYIVDNSEAIV